jgi:2-polyprenyl-3-methyl-5-hydroxy-6-metoxy-1,4-benzoquinol methylase
MRTDKNARLTFEAVVNTIQTLRVERGRALNIVDVGCGDGELLSRLRELQLGTLTGVAYHQPVLEVADYVLGVDVCQHGWCGRLSGRGPFDVVIATDVIEHLVNPYEFLRELRKLIADSGVLLLTFPNVHNLRSIVGYAIAGRFCGFFGSNFNDGHPIHDQHIFIPNRHLIEYFFRLTGFQTRKVAYVNGNGRLLAYTTLVMAGPAAALVP